MSITRREVLKGAGALVVTFGAAQAAGDTALGQAPPPGAFPKPEELDGWLAIGRDGQVTSYCGKVELGTGVTTAFAQLVADELDVPFARVTMVMGDTALCPSQGATTGSRSIMVAGPQLREAAADARATLLALAAARLGAAPAQLTVEDGVVRAPDGKRASYAELISGGRFNAKLTHKAQPKAPHLLKVVGQSVPRVELPGKVMGAHPYVQNLRLPGMLHGRVIRPPRAGAAVGGVDRASLGPLAARVQVVTRGNFVAVAAEHEQDAIRAARVLKVEWRAGTALPAMEDLPRVLETSPAQERALATAGNAEAALASAAKTLRAEYFVPFQLHASIGPSCAVADVGPDRATVWSATQSSFETRGCLATLLGMPLERVHLIWVEGSGCYGHNGADDATADAAMISQALGKPVRVQWMRHDEHGLEPKGVPMVMKVQGGLDAAGKVVAWDYQVWSATHSTRPFPGGGGNFLAGEEQGLPMRIVAGVGADRNARHEYDIPNNRVRLHLLSSSVLRVSALRGLGSPQNTFANESFMDELAAAAGADPVAFRLRHLKDERAVAVLEAAAKLAGWDARPSPKAGARGEGRGVAQVHYDNNSAYVAVVARVRVDAGGRPRVDRVFVAHDCGLIVNPNGIRLQIEGNVIQGLSRCLIEELTFDRTQVTGLDWQGYPILRFSDLPEDIAITLINRPDKPPVGGGEPGIPAVFAAVANAIFDATGARVRTVPFTAARVKAAMA